MKRPIKRGDCENGQRPCPWATCRYHLAGKKTNDVLKMAQTCSLDIADDGPHTLDAIAQIYGMTRERVRQIQDGTLKELRRTGKRDLATFSNTRARASALREEIERLNGRMARAKRSLSQHKGQHIRMIRAELRSTKRELDGVLGI